MLQTIVLTVFPALLIVAAVGDLLTFRIPNWISLALVGLFLVAALSSGLSWFDIGTHLMVGLVLLALGMGMFAAGLFGGGDAKLLAAVGVWIGWTALPVYLVWAAMFGGLLAAMMIVFRRTPLAASIEATPWIARLHDKSAGIPYGIALAAGALIALPQTIWFALVAAPL